jgi:hypothetical protein
MKPKTFYRVCRKDTLQGLWYDVNGNFSGLIHNKLSFCKNSDLKMDFDPELVGWLSVVDELDHLWAWFTKEDVKSLQAHGWFIHSFIANEYKFYEKFQHLIIRQGSSRVNQIIKL